MPSDFKNCCFMQTPPQLGHMIFFDPTVSHSFSLPLSDVLKSIVTFIPPPLCSGHLTNTYLFQGPGIQRYRLWDSVFDPWGLVDLRGRERSMENWAHKESITGRVHVCAGSNEVREKRVIFSWAASWWEWLQRGFRDPGWIEGKIKLIIAPDREERQKT